MAKKSTQRKPANLLYGVNEKPPVWLSAIIAFQHVCMMSVAGLVFPVVIMRGIGGSPEETQALLSLSMIAGGIATILQAMRKGWLGSGFLCPEGPDPSFLSASILAGKMGGLPLVFGMTIAAGAIEMFLAPVMYWLRFLFPAEVVGIVVAMVGINIVPLAVSNFYSISGQTAGNETFIIIAAVTLVVMIGSNVWGKGHLRQYSILVGMVMGYIITYFVGGFTPANIAQVRGSAVIAIPHFHHPGWAFNVTLLLPFMVAIICSTLKNVGDITTCQKINDANWKRLDMSSVRGGILADGLASVLAGCIGGVGQASYSANIGLSVATGVTSRYIAFFTGGLFAALAFFPKFTAILAVMPRPVMGAILVFGISFMILAGLQIMMSRMIDSRKTFVIGLSLIFGLSTSMFPDLYSGITPALRPVFMSPLSLATVLVVLLNLVLRIGTSRRAVQNIAPGKDASDEIHNFMEYQGGVWGAPRDVIMRAESAIHEFFESAAANRLTEGDVKVGLYYDEFNLDVDLEYAGIPMDFPNLRPSTADILEDESALARLSGFLIRKYVDRMKAGSENGICRVQLHFDN